MIRVTISAKDAEGKSTIAAIIALALNAEGIPLKIDDGYENDALLLARQGNYKLTRNVASIVGRMTTAKKLLGKDAPDSFVQINTVTRYEGDK